MTVAALLALPLACTPAPDAEAEAAGAAGTSMGADPAPGPLPDGPDPAMDGAPRVETAVAVLHPTEGNEVRGTVRFRRLASGGLDMEASVSGLSPGIHAFHVHRWGNCTAPDGTSAGPHYPFDPVAPNTEPDIVTGNLGELEAGADGTASRTARLSAAELNGARGITGRAVVVHARGNDPSAAPSGDTGPRLACGVIGIVETAAEEGS